MRFTARVTGSSVNDFISIVTDAQKKLILDLHRGLVLATPVDTGNLRAGWDADVEAGTISNPVEYLDPINRGHSKQAPAGFIEAEIDKATKL